MNWILNAMIGEYGKKEWYCMSEEDQINAISELLSNLPGALQLLKKTMNVTYQMVSLDIHPENEGTYIIVSIVTGSFLATLKFDGVDWLAIPRTPAMWLRQVQTSLSIEQHENNFIDSLLKEFNRQGFDTSNWDGDEGAEKAIVDGVRNHIDRLHEMPESEEKDILPTPKASELEQKFRDDLDTLLKKYKAQIEIAPINRRVGSGEHFVIEAVLFAKCVDEQGKQDIAQFDLGRIVKGF